MARSNATFDGVGEFASIGAREAEITASVAVRSAHLAQAWIFVDPNGEDVKRAALVEISFALMDHRYRLSFLADRICQCDTHVIAAAGERNLNPSLAGVKATGRDRGCLHVNLTAIDLHPDHLDRVGRCLDGDLHFGLSATLSGAGAG